MLSAKPSVRFLPINLICIYVQGSAVMNLLNSQPGRINRKTAEKVQDDFSAVCYIYEIRMSEYAYSFTNLSISQVCPLSSS